MSERQNQRERRRYIAKVNLTLIQLIRSCNFDVELQTPRTTKRDTSLFAYNITKIINASNKDVVYNVDDHPYQRDNENIADKKHYVLIHIHKLSCQMNFMIKMLEDIMEWKIETTKMTKNPCEITSVDYPSKITQDKITFDIDMLINMFLDENEFFEQLQKAKENYTPNYIYLPALEYVSPFN